MARVLWVQTQKRLGQFLIELAEAPFDQKPLSGEEIPEAPTLGS